MEPTELAGVADVETGSIYAWALDYDDPDEFPTERLTPRRITSLGLAVSLVLIDVAGVVGLIAGAGAEPRTPAASPAPSVTTVTVTTTPPSPPPAPAPPPPPPVTAPTVAPAPSVPRVDPGSEANFVSAIHQNIAVGWVPNHRIIPGGVTIWPTDRQLVASGYRACQTMAQHPGDLLGATTAFYATVQMNDSVGVEITPGHAQVPETFMSYATMLCNPER